MALTNKQITDLLMWITGKDCIELEKDLRAFRNVNKSTSDADFKMLLSYIQNRPLIKKKNEESQKESSKHKSYQFRYEQLSKQLIDNSDKMTVGEISDLINEMQNIEYKIEAYESKIK